MGNSDHLAVYYYGCAFGVSWVGDGESDEGVVVFVEDLLGFFPEMGGVYLTGFHLVAAWMVAIARAISKAYFVHMESADVVALEVLL